MKKLIEALTIFARYRDLEWPTHCEHDVLYVVGISYAEVSDEDRARLDELGFVWSICEACWLSFRYGSA